MVNAMGKCFNELCSTLIGMRLRESFPLASHVIKMINILSQMDVFEIMMSHTLKVNFFLQSLKPSYKSFIANYNLN